MNQVRSIATLVVLLVLFVDCKKDDPLQPHVPTIQISAEGGASTDAMLRVKLMDASDPRRVALLRDGQPVLSLTLIRSDSLIIDEGLLPRHTYTYTAARLQDSSAVDLSSPVQVTTLDTTSHDWILSQPLMFGDGGSSILRECQVVNDSLAYAVGEIYKLDSTGHLNPLPFNLARWDGHQWSLARITVNLEGNPVTVALEGIFCLSGTDIWLEGSIPIHGDGSRWNGYDIQALVGEGASVSRAWGSTGEMVFVGRAGNIIHYAGSVWQRIQSGTTETINDIFGGGNPLLGENSIVMAVGWQEVPGETKLLVLHGSSTQVDTLPWPNPLEPRWSVWFDNRSRIYTCGGGVYVSSNNGWRELRELPLIYTHSVRGSGPNDIMVAGEFGYLGHFNGSSWHTYSEVALAGGSYQSVAIKGNLVVAVGWSGSRAVAVVGHR